MFGKSLFIRQSCCLPNWTRILPIQLQYVLHLSITASLHHSWLSLQINHPDSLSFSFLLNLTPFLVFKNKNTYGVINVKSNKNIDYLHLVCLASYYLLDLQSLCLINNYWYLIDYLCQQFLMFQKEELKKFCLNICRN